MKRSYVHRREVRTGAPTRALLGRGFTLIEILIVVVILGILASVVFAHFRGLREEAKKAALSDTLHQIRSQILLYALQHGDQHPTIAGANWAPLTTRTVYSGKNCGPYLPSVPVNLLNNFTDVMVVAADPAFGDPVATPNIGFVYNPNHGVIWATNTAGDRIYNEADPTDPNN
jgi:prepilin-type N-terminal cleavage/methylation domain-containing protein